MAASLQGIVINEILADPNGAQNFDTDGNGAADTGDEFVELYNTTGAPVDISGWTLNDADGGSGADFTFPAGTIIPAGGHVVVVQTDIAFQLQNGGHARKCPWSVIADVVSSSNWKPVIKMQVFTQNNGIAILAKANCIGR